MGLCLSCVDSSRRRDQDTSSSYSAPKPSQETNNNSETPSTTVKSIPRVELSHFIDPMDGSYTRKLTLPRNYDGQIFIAGLNVGTLANKSLRVRLSFGREKNPRFTYTATTGKGPGATSTTTVDVLILDLQGANNFYSVPLYYDLYDYNQYDFDTSADKGGSPTQSNRNPGLYCRGLGLQDDPTFSGSQCNANSSNGQSSCLYSYAGVKDQGLQRKGADNFFIPSRPTELNISRSGNTPYFSSANEHTPSVMTRRCLRDYPPSPDITITPSQRYSSSLIFNTWLGTSSIGSQEYRYAGPFRIVNKAQWALPSGNRNALFGKYGIFRKSLLPITDSVENQLKAGVASNLFPRYYRKNLGPGVEHLATSTPELPGAEKGIQSLIRSGQTNWMDGCNGRVATWNSDTNEHMGSCNVTANLELLYYDYQVNKEILILESKKLKLQLVPPAQYNSEGESVLSNSFSKCDSNSQCAGNSCCYNGRCWSKDIISQCLDESHNTGNLPSGSTCNSDLQCASLCCDMTRGKCNVHQNTGSNPILCNKPPTQYCVAREWCVKQTVRECYIVDTGPGKDGCRYECFNISMHGNCINNRCVAPQPRASDPWDPNDPNRCDKERDPSQVPPPY